MKIDRRFLDARFIINRASDGGYAPSNPVAGDIVFSTDSSFEGIHKYDGNNWIRIPPNNADQLEFIDITNGNIIKSDGTAWAVVGVLKTYLYVKDVLEDKVYTNYSGETHRTGDRYLNTNDNKIYTYDGSSWVAASSTASDGKYVSKYDYNIYTKSGSSYTSSELPEGCIIVSENDLSIYAYNSTLGVIKANSVSGEIITERHIITSNDVEYRHFDLSHEIVTNKLAQVLVFVNGVLQDYSTDYTTSNYEGYGRISWDNNSLGLYNTMKVGDKVTVQYSA